MIEIKHIYTGNVLHTVEGDTLEGADLSGANLNHANLRSAHLSSAQVRGANLSSADLIGADLIGADLTNADLTNADLSFANLQETILNDAYLIGAYLWKTKFIECSTLHHAKGLDTINHTGASSLDAITLRACVNHLPTVFLRGVGYNQEEIETLCAMYAGGGIKYYSCFISYAYLDELFAERLHNDLEANGVVCWKDSHDMRGGDYYRKQINEAIKVHDKLVLVCSKRSTVRPGVIEEIVEAMEQQQRTGTMKLFPIRLDSFLFSEEMKTIAKESTATGDWPTNWIAKICAFHVPDFSKWKQPDAYQKALQTLLRDLKQ